MPTAEEETLYNSRPNTVDHGGVADLHYLGNYVRKLPVSLTRMMENAYDWEHLPFVHSSTFAAIELIDSGPWGWRAKVERPPSGSGQHIILEQLVDKTRSYWATTTLSGVGAGDGVQIQTQANSLADHEIEIEVRFYLNEPPQKKEDADFSLAVLQAVYAGLYDEDTVLMSGRQTALEGIKRRKDLRESGSAFADVFVGKVSELNDDEPTIVETPKARFCVRKWRGKWVVHSADCPHRLGPLEQAPIADDGTVTCPWHGHRFDIVSGQNCDGKCGSLASAPTLVERDGGLYLVNH